MIYLLIGKENTLKKEFIRDLRNRLFPSPSGAELNFQEFSVENHSIGEVMDFVTMAPFLSEKRMAVYWGIDELEDDQKKSLPAALARLTATALLVLA